MYKRWWGLLAVTALVAGCGGGGGGGAGGSSGPAIAGAVVKGPVSGATVCVYALTGGAKGAQIPLSDSAPCATTGADGAYNLVLPAGTTGDVLVESTGGAYCSDETQVTSGGTCAAPANVVSLAGTVMSGIASAPSTTNGVQVYLTPLTTAAVQAAAGNLSTATFQAQFSQLATQILGANSGVTPSTAPTPANQPFLVQVAGHMANGGSLSSAVTTLGQGSTSFPSGPGGATEAATVNAALVGSRTLTFRVGGGSGCGAVCSYQQDQQVAVVIGSDSSLRVGALELRNPFFRKYGGVAHTPEIIWLDAASGIEYAMTNNDSGQFSEINVGDSARPQGNGIPGYVGQLLSASTGAAAVIARVAGTYAVGTQYRGANVGWTSVTVAADGAITFNGGSGPNVSAGAIVALVDYTACCGRVDITVNFELDGNSGLSTQDKVSLWLDATGALRSIEYPAGTSAVADDVGVILGSPTALPAHTGAEPSEQGLALSVGASPLLAGSNLSFNGRSSSGFSLFADAQGSAQPFPGAYIQVLRTVTQGGTYQCKDGNSSNKVTLVVRPTGSTVYNSDYGGRCSITITSLSTDSGGNITSVAGTFVAELHTDRQDRTPLVISDGVFRYEVVPD